MSKILSFLILIVFSLPETLSAMEKDDLVVAYRLPPQKNWALFQRVVRGVIPGKVMPEDYHITLAVVKDVKWSDAGLLRHNLESIARIYRNKATFSPTLAKKYLVNRRPEKSSIVLAPKAEEVAELKTINKALHDALQVYNTQMGKEYVFHRDLLPKTYDPHLTLANKQFIKRNALDRDQLINRINTKLRKAPLELLHVGEAPKFKSKRAPRLKKRDVKNKKAPHAKKRMEKNKHASPAKKRRIKHKAEKHRALRRHKHVRKHRRHR